MYEERSNPALHTDARSAPQSRAQVSATRQTTAMAAPTRFGGTD